MNSEGKWITILIVGTISNLFLAISVNAETWQYKRGQQWQQVSQEQDNYQLAVSQIKQLVDTGQTEQAAVAFDKLKKDYPEIAGDDYDAFVEIELLFADGNLTGSGKSCEKFVKKFPESRFYQAVLDRQYAIATAFLSGQKRKVAKVFKVRGYAEGQRMMEKISDRSGQAPMGLKALQSVAESLEKRGKYEDAYEEWSQISSRYGDSDQIAEESLLAMGRCKHGAYKGPQYDASDLISAQSYYKNYVLKYVQKSQELEIQEKLKQISEQQAYKQFQIGRYYQNTGSTEAANLYYQMVMENWPDTTAAKMAKDAFEGRMEDEKEKGWKRKTVENIEKILL